ncbi:MAG: HigA family addiction module antitoxin [Dehalococcoidia bacterium]
MTSDLSIHPGEFLAEEFQVRGMTQRELARQLGRPEQVVSEIVNGKKGITAETALGLESVLGASADFWLGLQMTYELAKARRRRTRSRTRRKSRSG